MPDLPPQESIDVARLFSTSAIRPILKADPGPPVQSYIRHTSKLLDMPPRSSRANVFKQAFRHLAKQYPVEYIYKNHIAEKLFFGRHRGARSVLINEFRVAGSIADCVLANGTATAYEIKTPLDSPRNLLRQLEAYYKVFDQAYVVVADEDAPRYQTILKDLPTGLIAVTRKNTLSMIKQSRRHSSGLNIQAMAESLRLDEVGTILDSIDHRPDVPNGVRYSRFLELLETYPPAKIKPLFDATLRRRTLKLPGPALRDRSRTPLYSMLVQLNPTQAELVRLQSWLEENV